MALPTRCTHSWPPGERARPTPRPTRPAALAPPPAQPDDPRSHPGGRCYPRAALLNHSCAPNCALAFEGLILQVRTLREVEAGEELCHSYVELCQPTSKRRLALRDRYGFHCDCPRCVDGLRAADGEDVDAELEGMLRVWGEGQVQQARESELARSAMLLRHALHCEDEEKEHGLTMDAVKLRRALCPQWSSMRYEAEGRALSISLAVGDNAAALECCRYAVGFLERTLGHLPAHPLLALQQYTLSDLEAAVGERTAALAAMARCSAAMDVTLPEGSSLRAQAAARLAELSGKVDGVE